MLKHPLSLTNRALRTTGLGTLAALALGAPAALAQVNGLPSSEDAESRALEAQETMSERDLDVDARLEDVTYGEERRSYDGDGTPRVVHPITAPNYSDDALITTDIRGNYFNHQFPDNGVTNGGAARVYDFQARYAVNERLQVMVSRAGVADLHLGGSEEFGLTDLAVGVKYALLSDYAARNHVAIGAGYEFGIGDEDTLGDDDEFRIFAAWTKGIDRFNFNVSANASFATGSESANGDSDRLSVHAHLDYEWNDTFSPVVELNYYSVLSNSDDVVTPFSGLDLASFGGNEDEDVLALGLGGEIRASRDLFLRLAYETPLTDNVDLFGYRWTASAIWQF